VIGDQSIATDRTVNSFNEDWNDENYNSRRRLNLSDRGFNASEFTSHMNLPVQHDRIKSAMQIASMTLKPVDTEDDYGLIESKDHSIYDI
jgi:hypothetical protein